ncbi:MAG TPA: hypothetical protein VNU28_02840, partial [Solirubrobacteraceae bacterium]|nr:hypothetical protein [Solirubrobacteraceae bacterium]
MSRAMLIPLALLVSAIVGLAPARAAFGPFTVVSGSPQLDLPSEYAYDAAISSDGNYVAYTGSIASQPGIYRMNLSSGQEEVVALGAHTGVPSISADGRYVSFTTDEDPLTGQPTGQSSECSAVYVRDMDESPQSPSAYTLASARDGSTESLSYGPPSEAGGACGSAASYRAAISADGQEVVFTLLSPSDLTSATPGKIETPADQIAVRSLQTHRTELVSVTRSSLGGSGEPVPDGAALTGKGILEGRGEKEPISDSTAAISADGSAIAWMGINVQSQTELATAPPTGGRAEGYAEPLWRRIGEGPDAPTRSVLSGGDSSAEECPPKCEGGLDLLWNVGIETTLKSGPIYGSFPAPQGYNQIGTSADHLDVVTPQLSADGDLVALLSTQPNYGEDPQYPPNFKISPPTANAFVVNMTPGLTRGQSITRLTAWGSLSLNNLALAGPIEDIAISPDGTRVAFITQRIAFPLAPPALITPPLSQDANLQLYEANLAAGTLELVSRGYDGQPANGSTIDVSLDADGSTIALGSFADNLAFGAGGTEGSVFVTREVSSPPGPGQQLVSPLPPGLPPTPLWRISATASRGPGGSLLLYVSVPGAGALAADATQVGGARAMASTPHAGRTRRGKLAAEVRRDAQATLVKSTVAHAASRVATAGIVRLRLVPAGIFKRLIDGHGGL